MFRRSSKNESEEHFPTPFDPSSRTESGQCLRFLYQLRTWPLAFCIFSMGLSMMAGTTMILIPRPRGVSVVLSDKLFEKRARGRRAGCKPQSVCLPRPVASQEASAMSSDTATAHQASLETVFRARKSSLTKIWLS